MYSCENYPKDVPDSVIWKVAEMLSQKFKNRLPDISDFNQSISSSFGKGHIITGTDYAATLGKCKVMPEEMKTNFGLQYIRRQHSTGHHYFISSLQDKGVDNRIALRC